MIKTFKLLLALYGPYPVALTAGLLPCSLSGIPFTWITGDASPPNLTMGLGKILRAYVHYGICARSQMPNARFFHLSEFCFLGEEPL